MVDWVHGVGVEEVVVEEEVSLHSL